MIQKERECSRELIETSLLQRHRHFAIHDLFQQPNRYDGCHQLFHKMQHTTTEQIK